MPSDLAQFDIDATVYQQTLDRFVDAFWNKDSDELARYITTPFCFGLSNSTRTFTTAQPVVDLFLAWRAALDALKTDMFHCTCRKAKVVPGRKQQMTGLHETYIISNNNFLMDPFLCSMDLVQIGGHMYLQEWRILQPGKNLPATFRHCFEEFGLDLAA